VDFCLALGAAGCILRALHHNKNLCGKALTQTLNSSDRDPYAIDPCTASEPPGKLNYAKTARNDGKNQNDLSDDLPRNNDKCKCVIS
jgi:hypothetical protein